MFTRSIYSIFFGLTFSLSCGLAFTHPADENPELDLPESTLKFQQNRFGMFIHWGPSTVLCDGENVMLDRNISQSDYEKLPEFFNPAKFDAIEWVSLAKSAGMQYVTFTAKSRDGFAMWESEVSDWNVVERTPLQKDVLEQLLTACRRLDISLFLSYSPKDTHHTWLVNPGISEKLIDAQTTASLEYTERQVSELLTNYGRIDGIRLEGWWEGSNKRSEQEETYKLIRNLQPSILIGNVPDPGQSDSLENFLTYEQALPAPQGVSTSSLVYSKVPVEITDTVNRSRGYQLTDNQFKSPRELVHALVRAAGVDANFLLNVGPMPNGEIQQEIKERLLRVGMWLAKNGESVYSTRGGPLKPQPWGVTTHRNHKIYVHVLDPETTAIQIQLPAELRTARYLSDESDVKFQRDGNTIILELRPEQRGEMQRLLVLETKRYPIRRPNKLEAPVQ